MTDFLQISEQASDLDYTFLNYQAADIPAYSAVIIDTANALSVNNVVDGVAVKLPAAANGQSCIGFTMTTIPGTNTTGGPPGAGRVRLPGPIMKAVATAAITAGARVMTDATGNGTVITKTAGLPELGIALSSAINSGDEVLLMLTSALDA